MRKISVSEARENLPRLLEQVYFESEEFQITKRGIPMAKIIKGDAQTTKTSKRDVEEGISMLSGIWKNRWRGKSTNQVVKELRQKAWYSHAS